MKLFEEMNEEIERLDEISQKNAIRIQNKVVPAITGTSSLLGGATAFSGTVAAGMAFDHVVPGHMGIAAGLGIGLGTGLAGLFLGEIVYEKLTAWLDRKSPKFSYKEYSLLHRNQYIH